LLWLSSYVASHCLALAPLRCKRKKYCTVNYINSNLNCESQRIYKKIEKIVEDRVRIQNQCMSDLRVNYFIFKEKIVFKSH